MLKNVFTLKYLDLRNNKIADLLDLANLKSALHTIDLRGNPCTKWPDYRALVLHSIPSLEFVNGDAITLEEKANFSTIIVLLPIFKKNSLIY